MLQLFYVIIIMYKDNISNLKNVWVCVDDQEHKNTNIKI